MISLLECSPLRMSTKSIANSSEKNELIFPRSNNAQEIFDVIIDLLSLFEEARKNRRGHIWQTDEFENNKESKFEKTIEKNFLQKLFDFIFGLA